MRRLLLILTLLAALAAAASPASAHGDLVEGSPGPGDDVAAQTALLRLDVSALDPDAPVAVALSDEDGEPVAVGTAAVVDGNTLCARSSPLDPGVLTLEYAAVADDGHRVGGRYAFEVSTDGEPVAPGVCEGADLAEPGEARTLAELTGTDGGVPPWVVWGLVALALLAAAAVAARVRRDRREPPAA